MLRVIVLLYLNLIVLEPQHRRLVVIYVAVIRRTENGNDGREFGRAVPLVKLVPVHLNLMGSHHTEKVVHLQEVVGCLVAEEERTTTFGVLRKQFVKMTCFVLDWIRPHEVSKKTDSWNFFKSINFVDRLHILKFWGYTAVHSQYLIID